MQIKTSFYLIILVGLTLISCEEKQKIIKDEMQYYYRSYSRNGQRENDTISIIKRKRFNSIDSLIGLVTFEYKGNNHSIKMYTNFYHELGLDGGLIEYELDSLGVIYFKSLTWEGYGRLITNNDSLNQIINIALEHVIARSSLHEERAISNYR
jgi:hypothetical protein